jgi:hypothetical protein
MGGVVGKQAIPIGIVADLDRGKDVRHSAGREDVLDLDHIRPRNEFFQSCCQHVGRAQDQNRPLGKLTPFSNPVEIEMRLQRLTEIRKSFPLSVSGKADQVLRERRIGADLKRRHEPPADQS